MASTATFTYQRTGWRGEGEAWPVTEEERREERKHNARRLVQQSGKTNKELYTFSKGTDSHISEEREYEKLTGKIGLGS